MEWNFFELSQNWECSKLLILQNVIRYKLFKRKKSKWKTFLFKLSHNWVCQKGLYYKMLIIKVVWNEKTISLKTSQNWEWPKLFVSPNYIGKSCSKSDTKWRKVMQSNEKWPKVMQNEAKWCKLTQSDAKWRKVMQSDTKWHKVMWSDANLR